LTLKEQLVEDFFFIERFKALVPRLVEKNVMRKAKQMTSRTHSEKRRVVKVNPLLVDY
jgi:hypothetical protein